MHAVRIQQSVETGRFHPTYYTLSPLPGEIAPGVLRYRSSGHHTAGFEDLSAAQEAAIPLAAQLGVRVPDGGFSVRLVDEAGTDVLLVDPRIGA